MAYKLNIFPRDSKGRFVSRKNDPTYQRFASMFAGQGLSSADLTSLASRMEFDVAAGNRSAWDFIGFNAPSFSRTHPAYPGNIGKENLQAQMGKTYVRFEWEIEHDDARIKRGAASVMNKLMREMVQHVKDNHEFIGPGGRGWKNRSHDLENTTNVKQTATARRLQGAWGFSMYYGVWIEYGNQKRQEGFSTLRLTQRLFTKTEDWAAKIRDNLEASRLLHR